MGAFRRGNYNFLCPNNPEVRKYHSALVRNLLDYDLNAIQLESSSFPAAMQHGDHHEMFGAQVEPLASELMTVCFCEHCTRSAKRQGLDLAASRKLVREIIETSLDLPPTVLKGTSFSETLRTSYVISAEIEEIRKIQAFQRETVSELFRRGTKDHQGRRKPDEAQRHRLRRSLRGVSLRQREPKASASAGSGRSSMA